jgi:hypothetical protein
MSTKSILVQGGDGTAVPSGMVGEVIQSSYNGSANVVATTWTELTSIALTPGRWDISANTLFIQRGASGYIQGGYINVSTASGSNVPSGRVLGKNEMFFDLPARGASVDGAATPTIQKYVVDITVNTTYYVKYYVNAVVNSTNQQSGNLVAIRIA